MVDPEDEDLIMSLILKGHSEDHQLIEDILEEQHKKTIKFPITTFFHRSSLKSIISILNEFRLTRIQRPKAAQSERVSFSQMEEHSREVAFDNLMKSKSGLGGVLIAEDKRLLALKRNPNRAGLGDLDETLTGFNRDCSELENSFLKILEGIDGEEKLHDLEKYFLDRKQQDYEILVEDNLLKSFRKLRKIREALKKEMKKELKRQDKREDKLRVEFQERLRRIERRYLQERDFFSFSANHSKRIGIQVLGVFY